MTYNPLLEFFSALFLKKEYAGSQCLLGEAQSFVPQDSHHQQEEEDEEEEEESEEEANDFSDDGIQKKLSHKEHAKAKSVIVAEDSVTGQFSLRLIASVDLSSQLCIFQNRTRERTRDNHQSSSSRRKVSCFI